MSQGPALICKLLASSVSVTHKAGKIIRDVMLKGDLGIIDKGENDLQTEADRSAQRCIVASFKNLYPNIKIVAEEVDKSSSNLNVPEDWLITELDSNILNLHCPPELSNIKEDQITIWVDPLDGTSEFTKGLVDHVTTLIGICVDNDAVAGVIYQPFWQNKGRAVWGLVGHGIGGLEIKDPPTNRKVYVTSRSHYDKAIETFIDGLKPCDVIRAGGAGNKVLYVLEGKAHAYVYPSAGCKRWDTAAPEAVLRSAGGELTDMYGNKYSYSKENEKDPLNKHGVFATSPKYNHTEFMKLISHIRSKLD
ncbi:3'(2'),5'-bisphosphate nucleotidase 1 [Daktulosphaira vitifoliae]|uniref:3'(2'),5'-bisphosphate nucleotidase 1 n=1 Tax=Daktulosphaira vitifoliae TaxID=58002 RepID=UPI0021AADED9|nr:3'(2'),5'-bisphosphate nucleotidase 1 [Daktulosphaira vitifoliae]XP_050530332.1 3'(2'),5'-bisphosphate nucleotidase 1 [Daktulosphaira vitifoliae]